MSETTTLLDPRTIEIIKSTAPVLEQHGTAITSHFYKKMFGEHPELLNLFNHANQRKGRQQAALANAVYAAAAHIDRLESILPVVKQIGHKHRSLGVKPEQYPIVGKHLLGAIKDVLGEAATPEILEAWRKAYQVIADVFISVEQEMYDTAAARPGGWRDFRRFTVRRRVKESDVITSFYLVPEDGGALSPYLPGQYVSVRIQIPDEEYVHIRQYSLSDASGRGYYRISVKREDSLEGRPQGVVSNYLHAHVKEGDVLELSAPAGDFVLDTSKNTPVVFLSGGVGLTPLVSMFKTAVETQPEREAWFIHAAISGSHHALRDEVEATAARSPRARAFYVYECPTEADRQSRCYHHEGLINLEWLQKTLPGNEADFYLCGPLPFMKAMYQALKAWGVPADRVHYEIFGPAVNLEK